MNPEGLAGLMGTYGVQAWVLLLDMYTGWLGSAGVTRQLVYAAAVSLMMMGMLGVRGGLGDRGSGAGGDGLGDT
jgi:hypothetical protein